jgi:DNA mismatch endonuclease (patch repair protein)
MIPRNAVDNLKPEQRRACMAAVRSRNTEPELLVRKVLHGLGFRFRLHDRNLPGKPDIVLPKYHTVIFVHGCFWHGHDCSRGKRRPMERADYWEVKIRKNRVRDRRHLNGLEHQGWKVIVVWECEVKARDESFPTVLVQRMRSS